MLLEKLPAPAPSEVLFPSIFGFVMVPQQIPRDVIAPEPSFVIVPPLVALVPAILIISEVVIEGTSPLSHELRKPESTHMVMPVIIQQDLICFFIIGEIL
jgi:amino acid transporter